MFAAIGGSSKDDYNTIISPGFHKRLMHPEAPNAPGNYYAYLFVLKEAPLFPYKQIAIGYSTNNIAMRAYNNTSQTWTEWEEFVTNSDLKLPYIEGRYSVKANEVLVLSEATTELISGTKPPSTNNYVPVIIGHSGTNKVFENIGFDASYGWWYYGNASQTVGIRFYKTF